MADRDPIAALDLPAGDGRPILAAFTEVLATRTYARTSREDLLAASRLDPTSFDALFAEREDCFLQAYDYAIAAGREAIRGSIPRGASWPVRLAAGLLTTLKLIEAHPAEARLVLVEANCATPAIIAHHLVTIDSLGPFFHQGRSLVPPELEPPPMLDSALAGGLAYMLSSHLKSDREQPISDLYSEALRLLLLPYLGDQKTASFLAAAEAIPTIEGA